jgi:RNA 3'-terminal phosphate cyclase (ATP)
MTSMLVLDGSQGEGGGQILRSALGLSLVTGTPFRIDDIRAGRQRPGLMRQHLASVLAAAAVGAAEVEGAEIGSRQLTFRPGVVRGGEFAFAVGSAGSVSLVLQTVLPALIVAAQPSQLLLEGGTHNPGGPPFDYLAQTYLPLLRRMGPDVTATLERPGFYPAGGGRLRIIIAPVSRLRPLDLEERGAIVGLRTRAVVANLPRVIGEREGAQLQKRLGWGEASHSIDERPDSTGPGNVVMAEVRSEHLTEVFTAFGSRGVRAEAVANQLADEVDAYLATDVPVGPHLADQLPLLLALAGGGSFRTLALTLHTRTQLDVIPMFLGRRLNAVELGPGSWRISQPASHP